MSKVFLVYNTPLDHDLCYVKQLHTQRLGPELWKIMLKSSQDKEHPCVLSDHSLRKWHDSHFLSNKTVQSIYELGRKHGVDTTVPSVSELRHMDAMGVFYIE
jgi:hypothetical protein